MLKSASCLKCNAPLPLSGKALDFRVAPICVRCPSCEHDCETILGYRVAWNETLVWKLCVPLMVVAAVAWAIVWGTRADTPSWLAIGLPLLLPTAGAFIASRWIGFPLTLVVDRLRR